MSKINYYYQDRLVYTSETDSDPATGLHMDFSIYNLGDVVPAVNFNQEYETIVLNQYNELGELKAKKVGNGIQTIDYDYNVRGWLTGINDISDDFSNEHVTDLFALKLGYSNTKYNSGNELYNGNISESIWKTRNTEAYDDTDGAENFYTYTYDALNRITSAQSSSRGFDLNNVTYDLGGNITSLVRQGTTDNGGYMDDLEYEYANSGSSNKLVAVYEKGSSDYGFKSNYTPVEYNQTSYGSLESIEILSNGTLLKSSDDVSGAGYRAGGYSTDKVNGEGYVEWQINGSNNRYFVGLTTETIPHPTYHYSMINYSLYFDGSGAIYVMEDRVNKGVLVNKYNNPELFVNGTSVRIERKGGKIIYSVGGKELHTTENVSSGDLSVGVSIYNLQNEISPVYINQSPSENIASQYVYDDNGNLIEDKDKGITNITYNHLNLPTMVQFGTNGNIEYIYDASGTKLQKKVNGKTIDYLGTFQYEDGSLTFISQPEGYIYPESGEYKYVYQYKDHLGNNRLSFMENNGSVEVVDESHYYPFGLEQNRGIASSSLGSSAAKKYQYNGKEMQDDEIGVGTGIGLNMYDYGARHYDPALGRWFVVDPMAHEREWLSPYNYVQNNPISRIDPDGAFDTWAGAAWYKLWNGGDVQKDANGNYGVWSTSKTTIEGQTWSEANVAHGWKNNWREGKYYTGELSQWNPDYLEQIDLYRDKPKTEIEDIALSGVVEATYGLVDNAYVFGRGALGLQQRRMSGLGFKDYNHRIGGALDGLVTVSTVGIGLAAKSGLKLMPSSMSGNTYRTYLKGNTTTHISKTLRKQLNVIHNNTVEGLYRTFNDMKIFNGWFGNVKTGGEVLNSNK